MLAFLRRSSDSVCFGRLFQQTKVFFLQLELAHRRFKGAVLCAGRWLLPLNYLILRSFAYRLLTLSS